MSGVSNGSRVGRFSPMAARGSTVVPGQRHHSKKAKSLLRNRPHTTRQNGNLLSERHAEGSSEDRRFAPPPLLLQSRFLTGVNPLPLSQREPSSHYFRNSNCRPYRHCRHSQLPSPPSPPLLTTAVTAVTVVTHNCRYSQLPSLPLLTTAVDFTGANR